MTDPDPTSQREQTLPSDALRDYLELVDQVVDTITDADVGFDLAEVLAKAGYGPVTAPAELQLTDFGLADLPGGLDTAALDCQLRATRAELAGLQTDVAAARRARRREVGRLHAAVAAADAADLRATEARERAHVAAAGAEAYVDTALDRAQEILDRARMDAEQIITEAQRQAAEINVAAAQRAASSLHLPDVTSGPRVFWGEEGMSVWSRMPPDGGHDNRLVGLTLFLSGQRVAVPAKDSSADRRGEILWLSTGSGKSWHTALAALDRKSRRRRALEEERQWQTDLIVSAAEAISLPTTESEIDCTARLRSPGRWTWAALCSALRRAFSVPRLCQQDQPSVVESAPGIERSERTTAKAGPVHRADYTFVTGTLDPGERVVAAEGVVVDIVVARGFSIQLVDDGDGDGHLRVGDLVADPDRTAQVSGQGAGPVIR